jgi:carbamoyltransferase
MIILGLNAYHGDASAAIIKDGELICAIEEERIRRIKHWAGMPSEAIKFCLADCGISIADVDYIAISRDPNANFFKKAVYSLTHNFSISKIVDRLMNAKKVGGSLKGEIAKALGVDESGIRAELVNVEHHKAHMASTFFASPFEESAILSIDGFGDFASTMTGIGKGNTIEITASVNYPHSLGVFYTTFTQWLGFMNYGDEYKVMGLAPYGKPLYAQKIFKAIRLTDDGLFRLEEKYFRHPKEGVEMSWDGGEPKIGVLYSDELIREFGAPRAKDEPLNDFHRDMAASIQKVCEETIFHILRALHAKTGQKNICLAGGVAQNSVANGKILQNTPFEHLYIPPAGHDAGTSIGAALWVLNTILNKPRIEPMMHGYLGAKFEDDDVDAYLSTQGVAYEKLEKSVLLDRVTDCLIDGGVVGWFQGRAEFGPRALGHRSIIADPRREDAKDILNLKIKRRESFRPFAPSILKERVADYFEQDDNVPFMEKVFLIKEAKRAEIPAVTHVDGTGRLQSVDASVEPLYHALISRFCEKTGVPILLNTSFNENEPIVNEPAHALDCFLRTKMDMLVLGSYVISR